MPCVLKQKKPGSPGVIAFTSNEAISGVIAKSARVRDFLQRASTGGEWIFGVHIQGDYSSLQAWPRQPWESFLMWANPEAAFLSSVPTADITPITCVNFLPQPPERAEARSWDICVVSRPSEIKRITETLHIIRHLFTLKEDLSVVFIVPDPRDQALGSKAYRVQHIDRNYFELPRQIFSSKQLRQISFLSSSQKAFGTFPISDNLISEIFAKSRFLLLLSHREGVPRVIAEALIHGTPCIVSDRLVSGLNKHLNEKVAVFVDDDARVAAGQINDALGNYARFDVDRSSMQEHFCDTWNIPRLREYLSGKIRETGAKVDGDWYLDELAFRLASHGRKHNMQFMNDDRLFFDWFSKVESCADREPDEDYLFGSDPLVDRRPFNMVEVGEYLKSHVWHPSLRAIRARLRA